MDQKPNSVKNVGLGLAVFSGLIIFSNTMGILAFALIGLGDAVNTGEEVTDTGTDPMTFLFDHYAGMCLIMIIIGILYLVGAIYMRRYRLWANRLVSLVSILLFVMIWGLMIAMSITTGRHEGLEIFSIMAIATAVFWSLPIVLLIRFLNKKDIKRHFT